MRFHSVDWHLRTVCDTRQDRWLLPYQYLHDQLLCHGTLHRVKQAASQTAGVDRFPTKRTYNIGHGTIIMKVKAHSTPQL
jgi:hypothetical protein